MVNFSRNMMEAAGLKPNDHGQELDFFYRHIAVCKLDGIILEASDQLISQKPASTNYRVAIGRDLNALCRKLLDEKYTPDLVEWESRYGVGGTTNFLLIVADTPYRDRGKPEFIRFEDAWIVTFNTFPASKSLAKAWAKQEVERLAAAFAASLRTPEFGAPNLKVIKSDTFGVCADGRKLYDSSISFSGSALSGVAITRGQLKTQADLAIKLTSRIDQTVAKFVHLAMNEEDLLKKFLFFFLSIEILTNRRFAESSELPKPGEIDQWLKGTVLEREAEHLRQTSRRNSALLGRFVCCAIKKWQDLTRSDLMEFRMLQLKRNATAHGERHEMSLPEAMSAQAFCLKLLKIDANL